MYVVPQMSYSPNPQFGVQRQLIMTPLDRGFQVDLALNSANQKIVTIRFGHTGYCKNIDEWLESEAEALKNSVVIYTVEMNAVPELVARYKLSGLFTIIFFFNNTVIYRLSEADFNRVRNTDQNKFSEIVKTVQNKIRNGSHQNNSTSTSTTVNSLDFFNSVTRPMPPPPPPPAPAQPLPLFSDYGGFAGRYGPYGHIANQNPSPYSGANIPGSSYYTNPQTYEITDYHDYNHEYNTFEPYSPYRRKNWFRNPFSGYSYY